MYRGTTPTIQIAITGMDLSNVEKMSIAMQQYTNLIEKGKDDVEITDNIIKFSLTQEETISLKAPGKVRVQIRAVLNGGVAVASGIKELDVNSIIKDGIL